VIHGKGIVNLQRGVHALLSRLPEVISFCEASVPFGGSGATIVNLRPPGTC
jgi:dsDNA-specific endonuclease/ATPase MutS2